MKIKEHKSLLWLPAWGLSILAALLSLITLLILGSFAGSIFQIDENIGDGITYIIYDIIIVIACFFICKYYPKSIWYVPILCNTFGIISAFVEPNFWITSLWIYICGGWVFSLISAIIGTKIGNQSISEVPK